MKAGTGSGPEVADGRDGGEPFRDGGAACHGTAEEMPYCSGPDCAEWEDCHGDKLRGYSARASEWREAFGL